MRNYKMKIAYDGTRYKGWQRLAENENTIQNIIEVAISTLMGYRVTIDGSGRTDAGVHAKEQVANVKVSRRVETDDFLIQLNEALPEDIQITSIELVKNSFHSRLSATGKQYCYAIDTREKPQVFTRKYTYHFPEQLDITKMKKAAEYLLGTHDYSAFCDKKEEKSGIRTINSIDIIQEKDRIIIAYYGSGFLNHMVRILTGTLLEVGSGQKSVEDIREIIASRARANAGFTAPARGLTLERVYYE